MKLRLGSFKSLLSKIVIAQNKNKVRLTIKVYKKNLGLLDFLWKQGYIYGYTKVSVSCYCILLKYGRGLHLFKNLIFMQRQLCQKDISALSFGDKNRMFFIKTTHGILAQKVCIDAGLGGSVFVKV